MTPPNRKEAFRISIRSARMPIAAAIRAIDTCADYDRQEEAARAVQKLELAIDVIVNAVKKRNGRTG